jgi:hypothetical protein
MRVITIGLRSAAAATSAGAVEIPATTNANPRILGSSLMKTSTRTDYIVTVRAPSALAQPGSGVTTVC